MSTFNELNYLKASYNMALNKTNNAFLRWKENSDLGRDTDQERMYLEAREEMNRAACALAEYVIKHNLS